MDAARKAHARSKTPPGSGKKKAYTPGIDPGRPRVSDTTHQAYGAVVEDLKEELKKRKKLQEKLQREGIVLPDPFEKQKELREKTRKKEEVPEWVKKYRKPDEPSPEPSKTFHPVKKPPEKEVEAHQKKWKPQKVKYVPGIDPGRPRVSDTTHAAYGNVVAEMKEELQKRKLKQEELHKQGIQVPDPFEKQRKIREQNKEKESVPEWVKKAKSRKPFELKQQPPPRSKRKDDSKLLQSFVKPESSIHQRTKHQEMMAAYVAVVNDLRELQEKRTYLENEMRQQGFEPPASDNEDGLEDKKRKSSLSEWFRKHKRRFLADTRTRGSRGVRQIEGNISSQNQSMIVPSDKGLTKVFTTPDVQRRSREGMAAEDGGWLHLSSESPDSKSNYAIKILSPDARKSEKVEENGTNDLHICIRGIPPGKKLAMARVLVRKGEGGKIEQVYSTKIPSARSATGTRRYMASVSDIEDIARQIEVGNLENSPEEEIRAENMEGTEETTHDSKIIQRLKERDWEDTETDDVSSNVSSESSQKHQSQTNISKREEIAKERVSSYAETRRSQAGLSKGSQGDDHRSSEGKAKSQIDPATGRSDHDLREFRGSIKQQLDVDGARSDPDLPPSKASMRSELDVASDRNLRPSAGSIQSQVDLDTKRPTRSITQSRGSIKSQVSQGSEQVYADLQPSRDSIIPPLDADAIQSDRDLRSSRINTNYQAGPNRERSTRSIRLSGTNTTTGLQVGGETYDRDFHPSRASIKSQTDTDRQRSNRSLSRPRDSTKNELEIESEYSINGSQRSMDSETWDHDPQVSRAGSNFQVEPDSRRSKRSLQSSRGSVRTPLDTDNVLIDHDLSPSRGRVLTEVDAQNAYYPPNFPRPTSIPGLDIDNIPSDNDFVAFGVTDKSDVPDENEDDLGCESFTAPNELQLQEEFLDDEPSEAPP